MADITITETSYTPDNFVIEPGECIEATFASGSTFQRGQAITLSGTEVVKTVADGDIYALTKDDVDATDGAVTAWVYYTGKYKQSVIEDVSGITITDAMRDTMRNNMLTLG